MKIVRVLLCVTIFISFLSCSKPENILPLQTIKAPAFEDAALQRAAASALGEREGTIIVMNPRDARIRAVINPRLAFEQAFPPGSAIKPFTALTALRSGIVDNDTRVQCKTTFQHEDFQIICSHPRVNNAFKLHHALAYSCNYFFGTVAERMNGAGFFSMLNSFGFGEKTGVNANENSGELNQSDWKISTALGNDEKIIVTPIQLLNAFTAFVNGGHLLRPNISEAEKFTVQEIKNIPINPAHRTEIIEGMQGCTQFGTASEAGLNKLPYDVIGKTGTSGASNGFRTQGWFVSFLLNSKSAKTVEPNGLNLGVIVFLKRSHGSEAASVAAEFYRRLIFSDDQKTNSSFSTQHSPLSTSLKVHLVRENTTISVELEDYIRGAIAAESSVETELEALKVQAIVSRTFALKNLQRHAKDGYDFCSLTHCQRYVKEIAEHNKSLILQASEQTTAQILQDDRKQVADVYFHAACGGMTTNLEAVWGAPSPSYLQSVKDDYCTTMSHKSWQQNIPIKDLVRALQSDERSNPGAHLENIIVTKRDPSGRAEFLTIEGERRKQLRGWEFALIVNRVLGWNILKSSRFEISRQGNHYIFRGSGFGHGLGLCQEGAHVMARRGMKSAEILAHYLPGAKLQTEARTSLDKAQPSSLLMIMPLFYFIHRERPNWERPHPAGEAVASKITAMKNAPVVRLARRMRAFPVNALPVKQNISSEHFKVSAPANLRTQDTAEILRILEIAYSEMQRRLSPTSINNLTKIIIHHSTADFVAATGQPSWVAGATRNNTINLQPIAVLRKRGILNTTLRHEFTHAVIEGLTKKQPPRWLLEGLAIHFAGEGKFYSQAQVKLNPDEVEKKLTTAQSPSEMKAAYSCAYQLVRQFVREKGEAKIWKLALNH